jgi:hypothetical protein
MATWRFTVLDFPEAQPLADLTGIEHDLRVAGSFCDAFIEEREKFNGQSNETPPNPVLWEALTVAASIRYARAFAKGVRVNKWVDTIVSGLPAEVAIDHRQFIEFRNKYIAHSVNHFEENRVVAYLMPEERGPRDVASVSVQHERMLAFGVEDARRLKALCMEMGSRITGLVEAEKAKVLEIARGLSVDHLYAQGNPAPQVPSWSGVSKGRTRKSPRS